jgi:hypothetical protein
MTTTTPGLDLDAQRGDRARARAARHEGAGSTYPIRFGGQVIAELQPEFAMSILEPLEGLADDIAFVIRSVVQAMQAMQSKNPGKQVEAAMFIADVLIANPELPSGAVGAAKQITRRVLGDTGYEAFTALNPTPWDVGALLKGVLGWYGVSLGESSPSTPSSPESDGETSKPTSAATTPASTPAAPGKPRAKRTSSARGGSSRT